MTDHAPPHHTVRWITPPRHTHGAVRLMTWGLSPVHYTVHDVASSGTLYGARRGEQRYTPRPCLEAAVADRV